MLSKLTLANSSGTDIVLHEDSLASRRNVTTAKGLVGVGALRSVQRSRPQAHGSINETHYEEGRTIALTGEVWSTEGVEKALEDFRKVTQVLLESLDNGGALLKWTEGAAGLKLQMKVTLDSEIEPVEEEAAAIFKYGVSLFAEDPRAYAQTLTTQTGASYTGASARNEFFSAASQFGDVAVDSTHIYWVVSKSQIGRAAINGTSIENAWIKTAEQPTCLAVDSGHVYWGTVGGQVGRATILGATIENTWGGSFGEEIVGVAVNASNIFVLAKKTLWKSAIGSPGFSGGELAVLARGGLAIDAGHIYWGSGENGIARANLELGEETPSFVTGTGAIESIVSNGVNLYWTTSARTIGRAKIAGTEINPYFITALAQNAKGIAVDAAHIYWSEETGETLGLMVKSPSLTGSPNGSSVTVAQAGNRPTPLVFKVKGICLNPSIVRSSDNARIALLGKIANGIALEIDTYKRTVFAGSESRSNFLNAGETVWSMFGPASPSTETYKLVSTSATAAILEVLSRAAYA